MQGSAFLMGYYAGVMEELRLAGYLVPGVTPSGGLSGGAFTLVAAHLGLTGRELLELWRETFRKGGRLAEEGLLVGRVNSLAAWELGARMPREPHKQLNGHLRIALSQLDSTQLSLNDSAAWVVDRWDDREDVISCLLGTSYLSCFSGPTTYTIFRNQPVLDGGYSSSFEQLCPNGDVVNCIKVASYYVAGPFADLTCDQRCTQRRADRACAEDERTNLRTQLYKGADPYVDRWPLSQVLMRCPPPPASRAWEGMAPYPGPSFVPQQRTGRAGVVPDISPGKFNHLPFWPPGSSTRMTACQWQNFALNPPLRDLPALLNVTFELGASDAAAWLRAQSRR